MSAGSLDPVNFGSVTVDPVNVGSVNVDSIHAALDLAAGFLEERLRNPGENRDGSQVGGQPTEPSGKKWSGQSASQPTEPLVARVERDVALSGFTTFRLGGPARIFVRAHSIEDLEAVADAHLYAHAQTGIELEVLTVGQGSNLLVGDEGFQGIAIHLVGEFAEVAIELEGDRFVRAGGAVKLPVLARKCAAAGCAGLGWMVGVPGSVGGAVRMNAGGHGSNVASNLISATVVDLTASEGERIRTLGLLELDLHYRRSAVRATDVVVSATFQSTVGEASRLDEELSEIVRWRRANQPGGANCGSVFTNPPGVSAGKLIDDLGLRGFRMDPSATAFVSEKHANFIQSDPGGRAADVWALIVYLRSAVFAHYGIEIHPEVRSVGFDASLPVLS